MVKRFSFTNDKTREAFSYGFLAEEFDNPDGKNILESKTTKSSSKIPHLLTLVFPLGLKFSKLYLQSQTFWFES